MLAFGGALIIGVVLLVRGLGAGQGRLQDSPTDILKRRYAKGEITREEYEQTRKDLED